jgi:UDPglucose 6-dehydrogenase
VIGIDPDSEKLEKIKRKETPFFEPGLEEYLAEAMDNELLQITKSPPDKSESEFAYIAVGTPSDQNLGINLDYVRKAAADIGKSLRRCEEQQVIAVKSTVTPGTTRKLVQTTIAKESGKTPGTDFMICSNPEFLREGRAIEDTECPDKIVIGSDHTEAVNKLAAFYEEFHANHRPPVVRTTPENAELIKYANNAFLATKISFINTIANIAERIPRADVTVIARAIGLDSRIGPAFLDAGLGYGGSCFPKDLGALIAFSENLGYRPQLLEAAIEVNRLQPLHALKFAKELLKSIRGKKVAMLGLAFKPNTDDLRGAVAIPIIEGLLREGVEVNACDPAATSKAEAIFGKKIKYFTDARDCIKGTDLAIIVTEWEVFKNLQAGDFISLMRTPLVYDGRRLYDWKLSDSRLTYHGIGLAPTTISKH